MYNGITDINNLDENEILDLLTASDELNFNELIDDLQNYLINEKKQWIMQNLVYVHKISSEHQFFKLLQDYCAGIIHGNPEIFLKSNCIEMIEKPIFISILEKEDLDLDEIDIWECVIQWGRGQIDNLGEKDVSKWNESDFNEMRNKLIIRY